MLAPISWLKDYVDINVSPETLAKKLVAIGFEVEEIIRQSEQAKKVVTAKLVSVEKHPSADRLRVAQADIGGRVIQVVTNVPVLGGEYVAVAPSGAVLAGGQVIKSGELRGVRSEGMLCGLEEVGVECDAVDGQIKGDLLRFPEGTPLGIVVIVDTTKSDVWMEDASIAARMLQLQAQDLGLGSCWVQVHGREKEDGLNAEEYVRGLLGIPPHYAVLNIVSIGYPDEERKPYDEAKLPYDKIHQEVF